MKDMCYVWLCLFVEKIFINMSLVGFCIYKIIFVKCFFFEYKLKVIFNGYLE